MEPKISCSTCAYHVMQKFADGEKLVCARFPPQVFGAFMPGPPGLDPRKPSINYIYETVYPQPTMPCGEYQPMCHREEQ